jgi:preprotein translocase subunit SecD
VARSGNSRPGRTLGVLVGIIGVIFGLVGAGVVFSSAQWSPKLALDLEGGTQIVLAAVPQTGTSGQITQQTLDEAVKIIRQRINGSGVSEAEITTQGGKNIVVSLPGKTDQATRDSVKRAAALEFRPVLIEQSTQPAATASPTGSASPSASPTGSAKPSGAAATLKSSAAASATVTPSASPTTSSNGMAIPQGLLAATPTPSPTAPSPTAASPTGASPTGASPTGAATAAASASPGTASQPTPTDASDTNWIDATVAAQAQKLDCAKQTSLKGLASGDPKKPLVTCSTDGQAMYILGPAELTGTDIGNASASLETNSQGATGINWQVNLTFKNDGPSKFAKVTSRLTTLQAPRNEFAIVLDGLVVSAPRTNEAITGGSAQITGNFTQDQAQALANQLKFGALPISFQDLTEQNISATLGSEQLQRGLLAGMIGLALVVLYSLAQYRALGLVTVSSLVIAGTITYGLVLLLGWRQGYRLSLAGVAGLIVAIGITADSFIVYFERVRDEVRDGRGLQTAVDNAWVRARRTILISDAVSFLAATVLFVLAIGSVRGFAFTLGLTTLIDVLVVFLFTHPTVVLLSRTKFFGGGHRLSGFDAEHLGRAVTYTGRGRVREQSKPARAAAKAAAGSTAGSTSASPGSTIAERRAAAERVAREGLAVEPGTGRTDQDPPPEVADTDAVAGETAGSSRRDA